MSELVKIRMIAFVSILIAALTLLVALQSTARAESLSVADLGEMTVIAPRIADVSAADLGEMAVIARRIPDTRVASTADVAFLGAMTITAPRLPATTARAAASYSSRAM